MLYFFVVRIIRSVEDEISTYLLLKILLKEFKRKGLMVTYVRRKFVS
jgi:hypothetical protein